MSTTDLLVMVAALTSLTFLIGGDAASLLLKSTRRIRPHRPDTIDGRGPGRSASS